MGQRAFYYYKKAADQGHIEAQYAVGHCYTTGQGVRKKNDQVAFYYLKKAAGSPLNPTVKGQ